MPELSEQNKQIADMWNAGVSGGDIAHEFNTTRSAILGRINRMRASGLELRHQIQKAQKSKIVEVRTKTGWKKKIVRLEIQNKETEGGIDILELGFASCRYVLNNSYPHRYCGMERHKGAYCKNHALICYTSLKGN